MGRSELLVSTPTSPSFMDLSLEPTMPKTPPLFIFESPYQVQVESFHLSSWTVNGNGLDMLPMAFFLQDDHERVENDQEQLLDAIYEHTFFLKSLVVFHGQKVLYLLTSYFPASNRSRPAPLLSIPC
ncbi:unnamed protein product [Brassica napus]|nr:unnamed protein product [Brassica napus]